MKNKVNRWMDRFGEAEEDQTFMIKQKGLAVESDTAHSGRFQSISNQADVEKVRYWRSKLDNCMKCYEETSRQVWGTMSEGKDLPVSSKIEDDLCAIVLSQVSRSIAINLAFRNSISCLVDSLKEKIRGRRFEIKVENIRGERIRVEIDLFSKVRDLKRQILGENIPLMHLGQLMEDNEYLMSYGIVPNEDILLKGGYNFDTDDENPRNILAQVSADFKEEPLNLAKISGKLEKIRDDARMHSILADLVVVLIPFIQRCMIINSVFRDIFRLFGQIRRQEGSNFPPFDIFLGVLGIGIQRIEAHWCTKVRKIRKTVSLMLKKEAVIVLMYRGQYLDDDEYLISYGCRPGYSNDISAEIYYN